MHPIVRLLAERLAANPKSKDISGRRFTACAPASPQQLAAAEAVFGHALPPILRQIYGAVANGGFGPGYGVMGVAGGVTDDQGETIESCYQALREDDPQDPTWQWDARWVPFCHWGCGVYSVVLCLPPYPVFYVDPGAKDPDMPMQSIVIPHKDTLDDWLRDWLDGNNLWNEVWS